MGWFTEQPGGLNRYLAALHTALEDLGEEPQAVVVASSGTRPDSVRAVPRTGAPLVLRVLRFAAATRRAAASAGVVDAHFALYSVVPLLLPSVRRRRLVVHFQGPWAAESRSAGTSAGLAVAVKRAVERTVYRRADVVVVLSSAFERILVDDYGVTPERVRVVAPGVDLERFCPGDRDSARCRLGLDRDAWVVLTVRRLVPRMGVQVLVEAWPAVVAARPGAVLLVGGDGAERVALEALADRVGSGASVRFLGRLDDDDLVASYRAADVTVVPSLVLEGFGLVTLESLACGTPVVVSDVGGLAEAPVRLQADVVVAPGDSDALARRLAGAAAGTQPLPGATACRRFAEGFSWAAVARTHVRLYRELLAPPSERCLRVVYLDHVARLSGGELALARLLDALDDVDATVVLAEDGPLVARLREAGAAVEVLPLAARTRDLRRDRVRPTGVAANAVAVAGYVVRLAQRLRTIRPDLVHTNSLKAALYGGVAARLAGVPVVWHVRDRIAPDYLGGPAAALVRALSRVLPDAVIANSATTLDTLPASRHRPGLWRVVPSPVPAGPPERPPRSGEPLHVGMVGRLAPWKGQHVFLEAFARAFPTGPERAVVIGGALFGEEAYEASLRRDAARLGISERVELRGHRHDVEGELARLDVAVHASVTPEPFGQAVVEAMAAGLPVVAPGAGGPAEVVTDGVDGILVPPGDIERLAAALRRLADDAGLRDRLGRAGRSRAVAFRPEPVAASVMELYRDVLAQRPGRRPTAAVRIRAQ
jgi:glycosyltransferase involved in cell wall biosynthesis